MLVAKRAAAVVALVVLVGACGSAAATPSASPASGGAAASAGSPAASAGSPAASAGSPAASAGSAAPVTLSIWDGYPAMDAVWKAAAAAYQVTHPNFKLTIFSTSDLRGYEQKLATALPSKTAGDILMSDDSYMLQFIDAGVMAQTPPDIQALVTGGAYSKPVVGGVTEAGKTWGVPIRASTKALFYNTDMFKAAGISQPPQTMDEILADAAKLVQRDSSGNIVRSGISLRWSGQGAGVGEKFETWMLQYGGSILTQTSAGNPGKWKASYNTPAGVSTLKLYVDALKDGIDNPRIDSDTKAFEKQSTAMYVREPDVIGDIAKNAPSLVGHYSTVHLPVGSLAGMTSLYVPEGSPNQAAAWDFVNFLAAPAQQLSIPALTGALPARSDLDTAGLLAKSPGYTGFLNLPSDFVLYVDPPLAEFPEIQTKLSTHLVSAFTDTSLAGNPTKMMALLNQWADETNAILKQAGDFGE